MKAAQQHECAGSDMAHEALDAILNGPDQASAYRYLLGLLNNVSGCSEKAKGARRGAALSLVNVIERGLAAIRADGAPR